MANSGYRHGIYSSELRTTITSPVQGSSGIVVAVGCAPVHLAASKVDIHKPVLATKYSEAVEALGFSEDFDTYTLCEVIQNQFSLYNVAPLVLINVLDPARHFNEVEKEVGGVTAAAVTFEGAVDLSSFKATSGEKVAPTQFTEGTDFEVEVIEADDTDAENPVAASTTLKILSGDKVVDGKIKVTYRQESTALGGEAIETEVTLEGTSFALPTDTIAASVTVESGGSDTLQELVLGEDYKLEYIDSVATFTLLNDSKVVDDTINVTYHELDPSQVTTADILGGVDIMTGESTGIELIDSVYPRFNLVAGTLIAPKFSTNGSVVSALVAKARNVSGMFPAMAAVDLDASEYKTYTAAIEAKNSKNLNDPNLIVCWPKVKSGDHVYHLSTQLAALMASVDATNQNIPYVSPSNQPLAMDMAVRGDTAVVGEKTEVYLTRDQANLLNANGICTALAYAGWKFWGVHNSCYPSDTDPRNSFINVRRVFNFVRNTLAVSYVSKLDQPLNRRFIESIVNSANLYLAGLVTQGALLDAYLTFEEDDNPTTSLMDGEITFRLNMTPASPARSISFVLSYSVDALSTLFG